MKNQTSKIIRMIIILTMMVIVSKSFSQSKEEHHSFSLIQSPGSYPDGFSIGLQYEHQNKLVYYGVELYYFPDLNKLDYGHSIARAGFNQRFTLNNNTKSKQFRLHAGFRGGFISRETAGTQPLPLLGLECGIQYTFKGKYFIGLTATTDKKGDSKPIWNEESHTVNSGYVLIGIRF